MKRRFERRWIISVLFFIGLICAAPAHSQVVDAGLSSALAEAQTVGIPAAALNRLVTLGYEGQVDPAAMARMLRTAAQAHREGIPVQPILNKIEEGIFKRMPASIIEQVAARRVNDYRLVRSLVEHFLQEHGEPPAPSSEILVRLTETLYCGLSPEDLMRMLDASPVANLTQITRGVEVFASLKQADFDPALSEQVASTGIRQGYFGSDSIEFARVLSVAKTKGTPERQIAATAVRAIESKISITDLSAQLGVTGADLGRHGPQIGEPQQGAGRGGASHGGRGRGTGRGEGPGGAIGGGSGGGGHGSGPGDGPGHSGGDGPGGGPSGGGGPGGGGSGGGGEVPAAALVAVREVAEPVEAPEALVVVPVEVAPVEAAAVPVGVAATVVVPEMNQREH